MCVMKTEIKVGDHIWTPRFLTVPIEEVFESEEEMRQAGYIETTYYIDDDWKVCGKSLDMYHMEFAACRKYEVTEMCGNCMVENTFEWDVNKKGYKTYCPSCGEPMMLCDACLHAEDNPYQKCTTECFRLKG